MTQRRQRRGAAWRSVVAVVALAAVAGCETTRRELLVDSSPQGADVYVHGRKAGQTPYVGPVRFGNPNQRLIVQVVKPGYWPDRQVRRQGEAMNVFVNLQRLTAGRKGER